MAEELHTQSFTRSYNKALVFYDDDDLDECIRECQEILEKQDCPRYHRIKTLVLLGSCVADLTLVGECYREAERLWQTARQHHSVLDVKANEALAELRELLEELVAALQREAEEIAMGMHLEIEDDEDSTVVKAEAEEEADAEMADNLEELMVADKEALGDKYAEKKERGKAVFQGPLPPRAPPSRMGDDAKPIKLHELADPDKKRPRGGSTA